MLLSKNQVVRQRRMLEKCYDSTCNVFVQEKIKKANGSTGFEEVEILTDEPCRLSYKNSNTTVLDNNVNSVTQTVKLFLTPTFKVPASSRIVVNTCGNVLEFTSSSETKVFITHQEVELKLLKKFS